MTGDRVAHPVLLSLANIHSDIRMKASHHAFLLVGLLPCPKFLTKDKSFRGPLENRIVHQCLDILCEPLKVAARIGAMLSDPVGNLRYCYMPLGAYIADSPEAALLAGVGGKTSHLTMAHNSMFGDSSPHEPRSASTTLAQLDAVASLADPWSIPEYMKLAKSHRLNGVHLPFWRDWVLATTSKILEPYHFLTPEPLHHWHKQFFDHDLKWRIKMVGGSEINFRFSLLQPIIGFRHFSAGVSELKQVTGHEHCDMACYIVGIIA